MWLGVTVRDCGPEGCVDGPGLQRETGPRQGPVALISVRPGNQEHSEFQPQVGEPGCWSLPGGEGKSWRGGGYGGVTIPELSRLPYVCSKRKHWTVRESAGLRAGRASLDLRDWCAPGPMGFFPRTSSCTHPQVRVFPVGGRETETPLLGWLTSLPAPSVTRQARRQPPTAPCSRDPGLARL